MMQQDGRHDPNASAWPSFLGSPPDPAPTAAHHAPAQVDPSGFRLPTPPSFGAAQPGAQFQYAPPTHPSMLHDHAQPSAPAAGAAAYPMHQPHDGPMHGYAPAHGYGAAAPAAFQSQPVYQHGAAAPALPAGAQQPFIAADGRLYAAATAHGFELMQGAAAQTTNDAAAAAAPAPVSAVRRVRWETIIPAAAAALLLCTVALFAMKFDEITGREQLPAAADAAKTTPAPAAASAEEQAAALTQARSLTKLGRYDEAKALVDPLLAAKAPIDGVAALSEQIDTSSKRNDELLALLGTQRQAGSWLGVVTTIGRIKELRPLTTDLVAIRTNAQARVTKAQRAKRAARVAKATAAKRRAATAKATSRRAASARSNVRRSAPRAGQRPGATGNVSSARPPAQVSRGAMPPQPTVANTGTAPTGGGVTGTQPAVTGGGGGGACHSHGGVTECH